MSEEEAGVKRKRREGDVEARLLLLTLVAGVVLGVVLTISLFFLANGGGAVILAPPSSPLSSVSREKEEIILEEKQTKEKGETRQPFLQQPHLQTRAGDGAFTIIDIVNDLTRSDMELIALFFLILVVVDLLWELMTEVFQHNLQKNHPHILTIVERLYLELAVVGLVSMVLFFLVTSGQFSDHVIHVFEFCHLALFGVTALFIFSMIFVSLLSIRIFKLWEKLELVSVDSFEMKKSLADLQGVPFYDIVHYFKKGQAKRLLHYWSLRRFFVERMGLNPTFPFDRYLKGCTKYLFSELAQVHWSVLAITVFSVLGLYYGFTAINEYGPPLIIFSAMVFFLGALLHWKSRKIFLQMVAQRERVLVFSKILDERAEKERSAEERGEVHMQREMEMEEMVRNSLEKERKAAQEEIESKKFQWTPSIDPLIGGEEVSDNPYDMRAGERRIRGSKSVRRRKRVVDEEDASYLSYSDTASSTSGESYVSSASSCYSDEWGTSTRKRTLDGDEEQDIEEDEEEGFHHLRHVHHHHHHHHHLGLDEETKLAQSDLYFILHCCIPCLTCRMNPFKNFGFWVKKINEGHGHEALFWFRSPGFLLYLIQLLLFSQASQIVLAVVACAQVFPGIHPAYLPFAMLMGLINLFHLIPMIIYHFTMAVNVGVYTKKAVVRKVGKKSRHHRRLDEENEEYDPDYGIGEEGNDEEDDEGEREGLEREESPKSSEGGEIEIEITPPTQKTFMDCPESPSERKRYHHIRRKPSTKKPRDQGMVFKAHKEDDVDAFLKGRGVGAADNEFGECFEHPEEEIENFSKYLREKSAALELKKPKKLLKRKKKPRLPPAVKMVEMEARNSMQLAPPLERPRTSLDRPRNSLERRGNSLEKSHSSMEKPRSSSDRPRNSMDWRESLDGERKFHYHHHV